MPLRDTLQSIVSLQSAHTSVMSPAMAERGELVRHRLREDILDFRFEISAALGRYGDDLAVEGSDGIGRKALVPWTRYFSRRMSPSATQGWYVVYLFHPDATGVSLCLSHASTVPREGNFKGISHRETAELVQWGRAVLGGEFVGDATVKTGVSLGGKRLAAAYEKTTLFSRFYPSGDIPDDRVLGDDLVDFARALAKLYRAEETGLVPGTNSSEIVQILQFAEEIASPAKFPDAGQGWGLDHAARTAVELRAMEVAEAWLTENGFIAKDVSATESCDFFGERDGLSWVVEVKGTTGGPKSVLLTRNEVQLHRESYPRNALLIVHGIRLSKEGPTASGGTLLAICPWKLDEDRLEPTSYEYRVS